MRDTKKESGEKQEKTYTAKEAEELARKRADDAVKRAKEEWERETTEKEREAEEKKRYASMSDEERTRADFEKRERAFADEKKRYMSDKMEFEATKLLAEEKLPIGFARLLRGEDIDKTNENINMFKTEFLKAISEAINDRLKGSAPRTSSVVESNDPFLTGFGI